MQSYHGVSVLAHPPTEQPRELCAGCALRATTAKHALLLRDGGRELPRVRRVSLGRCLREGGEGAVEGEGHRECVAGGAARSGGGVS
jgi:hypothetical protein